MGEKSKMTRMCFLKSLLLIVSLITMATLAARRAHAGEINLPPQAAQALNEVYSGNPDAGINTARSLEESDPRNPLGYTIEAEALWWKIYCASCGIQWGMVDAWKGGKGAEADTYLKLANKVIRLANAHLANEDSAEMRLYAGMGWALEARLYGLRGDHRKTAHSGVEARAQFVRALKLDPHMADAEVGLGLYNYYVDTLSPMLKFLRFFMGIPGGSKEEGMRQLQTGIDHGVVLPVVARFYLAKDLRTYDHRYKQALSIAQPLANDYPQNPIFLLLVGNLNAELGRNQAAASNFRAALKLPDPGSACAPHIDKIATSLLAQISQ
ncbi:MAG: hypothetical protein ACRD5K_07780 [Candidatus Acidiferrales bacterium]